MGAGEPAGRPAARAGRTVRGESGVGAERLPWAPLAVSGEQPAFYRVLNGFIL